MFLVMTSAVVIIIAGMYYHSKNRTVDKLTENPDLSDRKVEAITKMMTIQHKG